MTLVPAGKEHEAKAGVPVGPPDTTLLGLPERIDIALNNQLVERGLLTRDDLRGRAKDLFAALQAAYRVDLNNLMTCYR